MMHLLATTLYCIALHSKCHAHAITPLRGAYYHARNITRVLHTVEKHLRACCHTMCLSDSVCTAEVLQPDLLGSDAGLVALMSLLHQLLLMLGQLWLVGLLRAALRGCCRGTC